MGVFFGYLSSPSILSPKTMLPTVQNLAIRLFLPLLPLLPIIPPCSTAPSTMLYGGPTMGHSSTNVSIPLILYIGSRGASTMLYSDYTVYKVVDISSFDAILYIS